MLPIDPSRVTVLVHTADRPMFVRRLLRYYDTVAALRTARVMIADGSAAPHAAATRQAVAEATLPVTLHQFAPDIPLARRLRQAVDRVDTEYVMLAADDDLYFFDWLEVGLPWLDAHPECEVVVGDYLLFALPGYGVFGDAVTVREPEPGVVPIPFLDGPSPEERIAEHARSPVGLQTVGWYALQRTATLCGILRHAAEFDLPVLFFERFYTMVQACAGTAHFTKEIFIARQANVGAGWRQMPVEPLGYARNRAPVARLVACTTAYLTDTLGFTADRAALLVEQAYRHEFAMMRQADRRRVPRRLLNRVLPLRRLVDRVRLRLRPPPPRDERLPRRADRAEVAGKRAIIERACAPLPDGPPRHGSDTLAP